MANKQETKKEEGYKPGPYICIVEGEGFAFSTNANINMATELWLKIKTWLIN